MKKWFVLLVLCVIVLLSEIGLSSSIEVELEEKITLTTNEVKEILINITSNIDDRIVVYGKGLTTWMTIEDVGFVKANEKKSIKLVLSPSSTTTPGTYKISLIFSSFKTKEIVEKDVFITLLKETEVAIKSLNVYGNLTPLGYARLIIEINNPSLQSANNVIVSAKLISQKGNVIHQFSEIINLNAGETKTLEKTLDIPAKIEAGTYYAEVDIIRDGKLVAKNVREFKIEAKAVLEKDVESSCFAFGKRVLIRIRNIGNAIAYNESFEETFHPISVISFKHISGPTPRFYNNKAYWLIEKIEPGSEVLIAYELNYNYLVLLLILAIIGLSAYVYKLRGVVIRKKVLRKGENLVDIILEIKNNTGRDVEKVVLRDYLPIIFKIKQIIGPKPIIKSEEMGTEIKWRLGKLKKGEERIISYKAQEVIRVEGEITMPSAEISYVISDKTFVNKSGGVVLNITEKEEK